MKRDKERERKQRAVDAAIEMVEREYHLAGRSPDGDPDYRELLKLQRAIAGQNPGVL